MGTGFSNKLASRFNLLVARSALLALAFSEIDLASFNIIGLDA